MTDLKLRWGADGGDLERSATDLVLDDSLVTAVLVSLFSDARADANPSVPIAEQDLRGWWGEEQGDAFGSSLWQLEREKITTTTIERARTAARAALEWLLTEGIASAVDVRASRLSTNGLLLEVGITRGTAPRWAHLWRGTIDTHVTAGDVLLALTAG